MSNNRMPKSELTTIVEDWETEKSEEERVKREENERFFKETYTKNPNPESILEDNTDEEETLDSEIDEEETLDSEIDKEETLDSEIDKEKTLNSKTLENAQKIRRLETVLKEVISLRGGEAVDSNPGVNVVEAETTPSSPPPDYKTLSSKKTIEINRLSDDENTDVEDESDLNDLDTPYKPTYSPEEIARFMPRRRIEDTFEDEYPLDTEENIKRNQIYYKDHLMADIYSRFQTIAKITSSTFINNMLCYIGTARNPKDMGIELRPHFWNGLENLCRQSKEEDPGIDLLSRAIINYEMVAAIWPGIKTLDQLVIAQQKYETLENIDNELQRLHSIRVKHHNQDESVKQQINAYQDLKEQIEESSLETTGSEMLREDSVYMKSTPKGKYGKDPDTGKKMLNRPLYTIQSALNQSNADDSWSASQPASKVVLDKMRDQLASVNPNTILAGANIQIKQPVLEAGDALKASKDALYKTKNEYLCNQIYNAVQDYYVADKTENLGKFNKLFADVDFLLKTSISQEKTHYLILSRIQDALDIEERHFRKPLFSYFGKEKSKQDFNKRLDKNDNEYTYPRALRNILTTRLLDPLAMTNADLWEGLSNAQPGKRIRKGTQFTPPTSGKENRAQHNLSAKSIDVGEDGTYYIPAGKKIWLCEIYLMSCLPTYSYDDCRKSDKTHLYLYQDPNEKGGVGPFYYRENDPNKYYLNTIKKAGDVPLVYIGQDAFNSTQCTKKKLIKTILDITYRKGHTKSAHKTLGAGAFGEVNRAALSFKFEVDPKTNVRSPKIDSDSWVQKVIKVDAAKSEEEAKKMGEEAKKMAEDEIKATKACAPHLMPSSLFNEGNRYWFYMKNAGQFKVEDMITGDVLKLKEEDYYTIFNDILNQVYNAQKNNAYVMYDIKPDNMMYTVEVIIDKETKKPTLKKQASIIDHGASLPLDQSKTDDRGETYIFQPPMKGIDSTEEKKEQQETWMVYQIGISMAELIIANSISNLQNRVKTIESHRRNRNPMATKDLSEIQRDREAFIADLEKAGRKLGLSHMVDVIEDMISPDLNSRYSIEQARAAFKNVKEEWEFNAKAEQKANLKL